MSWLNDATVVTAEDKQASANAALKQGFIAAVQSHLDDTARQRAYDGILSLCSYATDPDPKFSAEGQAGVAWRGQVWSKCYQILSEVESGQRLIPTTDELIAELPDFVWP